MIKIDPDLKFLIQKISQDLLENSKNLNLSISEDDEMLIHDQDFLNLSKEEAILSYFKKGLDIFDTIKQIVIWKFSRFNNIESYLDFASGYGRVTRFLVEKLSPKKVWISDIYEEGVKFQVQEFGVNGIKSTVLPEQLKISKKFDVISVISLFSHLPEKTFIGWLTKLYELLEDEGILIFSTHGIEIIPQNISISDQGITFISQSESRSLNVEEYGSTFVTESWVRQAVAQASKQQAKVHRIPRGLINYQDLYLVIKDQKKDFSSLQLQEKPMGYLDHCIINLPSKLSLDGWSVSPNKEAKITSVKIYINGQLIKECVPSFLRPDVAKHFQNEKFSNSGWKCSCSLNPEIEIEKAILHIQVIDDLNNKNYIYMGKLKNVLTNSYL